MCLEKMAAHYVERHGAKKPRARLTAKVLDDGSKSVQETFAYSLLRNDEYWFISAGLTPYLFKTVIGGCYAFDLQRAGPNLKELRFAVRQLDRGPPRHRLASVKVRFGPADGMCVQYPLLRALAADERLENSAMCAGAPPVVGRVDPALLAPTLVLKPGNPPPEEPWELSITSTLLFQVVRDAPP